jgi:hypothetical protein
MVYRTGYGAADNDCDGGGGDCLAYPPYHAGGTGAADDPVSVAAKVGAYEVGTLIYFTDLRLYGQIVDTCGACQGDQVDLWVDGRGTADDGVACMRSLTGDVLIVVNPDPYREVGPLAPVSSPSGCLA